MTTMTSGERSAASRNLRGEFQLGMEGVVGATVGICPKRKLQGVTHVVQGNESARDRRGDDGGVWRERCHTHTQTHTQRDTHFGSSHFISNSTLFARVGSCSVWQSFCIPVSRGLMPRRGWHNEQWAQDWLRILMGPRPPSVRWPPAHQNRRNQSAAGQSGAGKVKSRVESKKPESKVPKKDPVTRGRSKGPGVSRRSSSEGFSESCQVGSSRWLFSRIRTMPTAQK